jgi:hypothetical protein
MVRSIAVGLCCACFASACVDDSSSITSVYSPTLLTVDPTTFLGTVRCGSDLHKYVVTLFDVSTGTPMSLGSAPPTECNTPTTFGTPKIASLLSYIAEIDGYDTDNIVPEGGNDSGSRVMVDATTMAPVAPHWTTTCGAVTDLVDGQAPPDVAFNPLREPTVPLANIEVTFHGCLPLAVEMPDAGTTDGSSPDGPPDATTNDATEEAPDASAGE